ncbi:hypothetical protein IAR55_004815 [Kwoniella newhampshirensis]|uniref:Uncharacterized protein n=1 Tax=Kwoniella newhampshirensis TaxID=1651941 RepID=A0AAW0YJA7_9TREE
MLRRIRVKLRLPTRPQSSSIQPFHSRTTYSAAAVARIHVQEQDDVPYGMEYGAGPSRIPYQSRPSVQPTPTLAIAPSSTPLKAHVAAKTLREHLNSLNHGSYASINGLILSLLRSLDPSRQGVAASIEDTIASLSRLELQTILHHLIRQGKLKPAVALAAQALSKAPRSTRRRLISARTITALFSKWPNLTHRVHPPHRALSSLEPTFAEQLSPAPSPLVRTLLDILESLQDVRLRRPPELYALIIRTCVNEDLPDLAAKVYVGLVEEWVTEGRVAEGASPEDFYQGGGPPREQEQARVSEMLKRWWTGVRTWRLPGEVLSPHDRLDLWHPRHLSLGEKMRNFPVPLATSPPSTVPEPKAVWLNIIVNSLKLDPTKVSPAEFAASMRALAILANTVLSRTLPIVALGRLLGACNVAPYKPDVFPDNITARPEEDAWAFTAHTQIHVTLMSLLFSPPISAQSMAMIEANRDQSAVDDAETSFRQPSSSVGRYMLPPLSWGSCNVLLNYAFRALRAPAALQRLMKYMKDVLGMGRQDPDVYNKVLRSATVIQENKVAAQAELALFQKVDSRWARPAHAPSRRKDDRTFFLAQRIVEPDPLKAEGDTLTNLVVSSPALSHHDSSASPNPNEASVVHQLTYLTVTSQFDRLEDLVYQYIPFLDFSARMSASEARSRVEEQELTSALGHNGRPTPQTLTPAIYEAILIGLEKDGRTGLAQRVFKVAMQAEQQMSERLGEKNDATRSLAYQYRLPIGVFTTMLKVWENEVRAGASAVNQGLHTVPIGWVVPKRYEKLNRQDAAGQMAILTHELVRNRSALGRGEAALDKKYFDALVKACRLRWKLGEGGELRDWVLKKELVEVIRDMEEWDVEVNEPLVTKLGGRVDPIDARVGVAMGQRRKRSQRQWPEPAKLLRRMVGHGGGKEVDFSVWDSDGRLKNGRARV